MDYNTLYRSIYTLSIIRGTHSQRKHITASEVRNKLYNKSQNHQHQCMVKITHQHKTRRQQQHKNHKTTRKAAHKRHHHHHCILHVPISIALDADLIYIYTEHVVQRKQINHRHTAPSSSHKHGHRGKECEIICAI